MNTDTAILVLLADLQRTVEAQRAEIAAQQEEIARLGALLAERDAADAT